jgi:uncharacterized membrane protein
MKISTKEKLIEKEFHASIYIILYKFILGLVEFLTGVVTFFLGPKIYQIYQAGLISELSEDPHDLLAHLSEGIVPHLFTQNTYLIIYLLILGFAKMSGAIGLIYKQNWGVDLLVSLTILMAPFQIFNMIIHPNIFDFIYFIFGLLIALYLIEFRPKAWVSRVLKVLQ